MTFVFLSYINTPEFKRPDDWINRIRGYYGVLEALSERHTVISIEQIDYEGEFRSGGVLAYFLNYKRKTLRFPFRLHRFVRRLHPDVVVVHGLHFPLQVIQLRLALGTRPRIILQEHANKPPADWRKALQRLADRCTNAYLFTSREMAGAWLDAGLIRRENKIRELMVGSSVLSRVDQETARQRTGCTGERIFVWAGRLNGNKDPMTLIDAFLSFAETYPQARLYMIFQTDELLAEVKAQLEKNPAAGAIILVGRVAHQHMGDWFSAADFVISTSHAEAFGLAVVEAMACGCIPIVTDIPSYRKITGKGCCGLLFETGNPEDLLRALGQGMRLDLGQAQEKVSIQYTENLSFRSIAHQLDQIGSSL